MHERTVYKTPIATTDIIIEYRKGTREGIILVERKNPPYGYALPGGFAEYGISLPDNARKEAKEETNLDIIILGDEERPFLVKSNPERDPRGHMISATYIAKGYGNIMAGDDAKAAHVFTLPEVEQLINKGKIAFDHADIIGKYLKQKSEAHATR